MLDDVYAWDVVLHYDMTCYDMYDNEEFFDA